MKRILSLFLSILMVLELGISAFGADNPTITVSDAGTKKCGDTVSFDVFISNNPGIMALQFAIEYDDKVLTLNTGDPVKESAFGGNWTFGENYLWDNSADSTYNGKILTLNFTVKDDAKSGNSLVKIINVEATKSDETQPNFNTVNGSVMIIIPATALDITEATATTYVGETVQLTLTKTPAEATSEIEWTSSNTSIATVDSTGKVSGVAAGTVTITAKSKDDGNVKDTCTVTVGACNHNYGSLIAKVEPTCDATGMEAHYECSKCHKLFTAENVETTVAALTISKLAHHGVKQDGQPASCTTPGWKDYYQCDKGCRKFYEDESCTKEITNLDEWKTGAGKLSVEHGPGANEENSIAEVPATCTKDGVKAYFKCGGCSHYFYNDAGTITEIGTTEDEVNTWKNDNGKIEKINHKNATRTAQKDATCTADGLKAYWHCADCGTYFADDNNARGNEIESFDTWKTTKEQGLIEALGHTLEDGSEATCVAKAVCGRCHERFGEVNPANHVGFDRQLLDPKYLVHEATCTEPATYKKSCACGVASETLTFTYGSALGHDGVAHSLAATCTTAGYKTYYTCSRNCAETTGKYYSDAACTEQITDLVAWQGSTGAGYIAALGHSYVLTNTKEATCALEDADFEDGEKVYTCERCNAEKKERIPAHHTYGADGVCTGCGKTITLNAEEINSTDIGGESGDAKINTSVLDILNAVAGDNGILSDIVEQLANGDVTLEVEFNVTKLTPEEEEKADSIAESYEEKVKETSKNGKDSGEVKISAPIEIDLSMIFNGSASNEIHNLSEPIEIAVPVPDDIKANSGENVEYFVLRIHVEKEDDAEVTQVDILPATVDANGNLVFNTDKLSTFVPMVVVTPNEEDDPEPERKKTEHKGGITITVGERTEEAKPEPEENPNTGAEVPNFGIALVVLGAASIAVSKKRK